MRAERGERETKEAIEASGRGARDQILRARRLLGLYNWPVISTHTERPYFGPTSFFYIMYILFLSQQHGELPS